jgi:hypothetical protein
VNTYKSRNVTKGRYSGRLAVYQKSIRVVEKQQSDIIWLKISETFLDSNVDAYICHFIYPIVCLMFEFT